jgi:hypothetical protein
MGWIDYVIKNKRRYKMKYLKIFEDFFKFNVNDQITDTVGIWGYTREEIEDYFIHFVDYGFSVSVNFQFHTGRSISYVTQDKDILDYKLNLNEGWTPCIEVSFFTNSNLLRKYIGDVSGVIFGDDENLMRGFSELSEDLDQMILPILKGRIRGYDVEYRNVVKSEIKRKGRNDLTNRVHHSDGVEYGVCVGEVKLKKKS